MDATSLYTDLDGRYVLLATYNTHVTAYDAHIIIYNAHDHSASDPAQVSHANLTNVTASQHHTRYTDSEAILAIEGEATLVLAGDVSIATGKSLSVNTISEKDSDTGVTIDTLLIKDGNIVGPSGGMTITGGIDSGDNLTLESTSHATKGYVISNDDFVPPSNYGKSLGLSFLNWLEVRCSRLYFDSIWGGRWDLPNDGDIRTAASAASHFHIESHDGSVYKEVFTFVGGYGDFLCAGDITMLDQKMMQLGTFTDMQRPAAGTAGRIFFNTDDGQPNYDDGTDWRDINGNIT